MESLTNHIYTSKFDEDNNSMRESIIESEFFDKIRDFESTGIKFGKSSKDIIEFSVYSPQDEIFGWKLVEQSPNYITKEFSYKDTKGELNRKTISYLENVYPTSSDGGVIISPKYELNQLGIVDGEFKIKISYKNDIVGSFENPYKFTITEISNSRTEIKAVTQSIKSTLNPDQVAFNFEYENFIKKQILVGNVLHRVNDLLKTELFVSELEDKRYSSNASDYTEYILKVNKAFSLSELQTLEELDKIYITVKDFYRNLILGNLTEVFNEERFYSEYIDTVDFILDDFSRFRQEENLDIKLFYKYMLIQMFDKNLLSSIFSEKFDKYLSNLMNFGNGINVPILKYKSYIDDTLSENSNEVLLIKLLQPLDDEIVEDTNFYISQSPYSDDIIKNVILRSITEDESETFKLRGPDISQKITNDTTRNYTLGGDKDGLLSGDLDSAEKYFKTTNKEVTNLNIDYRDYKNFVKFSSARARLDNFVIKMTKISKIQTKINEYNKSINLINNKVLTGSISDKVALNSITSLEKDDIDKLNKEISDIVVSFSPYEKYLYYDSGSNSWPRETSFSLFGFNGNVESANGIYKLYASRKFDLDRVFQNEVEKNWKIIWDSLVNRWKLFNEELNVYIYSNTQNLSAGFTAKVLSENLENHSGFKNQQSDFNRVYIEEEYKDKIAIFPPELVPSDINEFKSTDGFAWYKEKAKIAEQYDKFNDDSLRNSIPEFLVRTNENDDFISFLNMIGEQFDIILAYTEAMSDMASVRNSFSKGVPNQLVWFVMNSFGVNFTGRLVDELSISKIFEENRNSVWRRILNNLPYILKSTGTEESLRALFRCYGVPDYLFSIREYGGVNTGNSLDEEKNKFRIDTYDYSLKFSNTNQYINVPLQPESIKNDSMSIEMRISLDEEIFSSTSSPRFFEENNSGKIPFNFGEEVNIEKIIERDDFIIGSSRPRFYSKRSEDNSYVHPRPNNESDIALSWKNFREGVTFSYPIVEAGDTPSFMTIYSDEAKRNTNFGDSRDYDPIYTLAEIGAQNTLNGKVVRLSFNQDQLINSKNGSKDFYIDFVFNGSLEGTHMTISELKKMGAVNPSNSGTYPIIQTDAWEFGVYYDKSIFPLNYGKFYFNLNNSDGILLCPSSLSSPIYLGDKKEYDILISKCTEDNRNDSELKLLVKRRIDSETIFEESNSSLISSYSSRRILETPSLKIGNYQGESFLGTLDRLRVYSIEINEKTFSDHIDHNQGYNIENAQQLKNNLIVKVNFDYPYDISGNTDGDGLYIPGKINNYIFYKTKSIIDAYNFSSNNFPFDFVGKRRREFVKLPSFGSRVFNNEKIRIENQDKISQLNPFGRSTKKSIDRNSVDTNDVGVYFSPSDILNREIIRFLGNINLGNLIGNPKDTYKSEYKKLESFKKVFFENRFGNLDIQRYFNLIKSYIDPSLFENIEKLVPARTNLLSGLLVEPNLLERSKIIPPRIKANSWVDEDSEKPNDKQRVTKMLSVDFDVFSAKNKNITSFANEFKFKKNLGDSFKLMHEADITSYKKQKGYTYDSNYGGSFIGEQESDKIRDLFSVDGMIDLNGDKYKIEKTNTYLKIGTEYESGKINYDVLLNDGIQISGFSNGLEEANGVYEFRLRGTSGLPVFANENRKWWVFYSNFKNSWILASDNTIGGAKLLAVGKNKNYKNFTWISGNKIYDNNTNTPDWFSTGFFNSIPSDNLPTSLDYFARVNYISQYDRFIEIDAYLQGWINAEIIGVYEGVYTERTINDLDNVSDVYHENNSFVFGGNQRYVYLNGNFRGKIQKGWVGSANLNETDTDKSLRIVGYFNGTEYNSCENPFYISGQINSLVSFDNRDKLVLDFRNFTSNSVSFLEKEFSSVNLVKVPSTISSKNKIDLKFNGDFNINLSGVSELNSVSSGVYSNKHSYNTTDIFNPPTLFECDVEFKTKIKTDAILDLKFLAKRIGYTPTNDTLYRNVKNSLIRVNFNKDGDIKEMLIENISGGFKQNEIYDDEGNFVSKNIYNFISTIKTNINFDHNESVLNEIEQNLKNNISFSIILFGYEKDNFDFALLAHLEKKSKLTNKIKSKSNFSKTRQVSTEKHIKYSPTKMHVDGIHQYIKDIEIIDSGRNYTGNEIVTFGGVQPKNWKSSWPQVTKVSDLFTIDSEGKLVGIKYNHYMLTGINWKLDETVTFTHTPTIDIEGPYDDTTPRKAIVRAITGEPTPKVNVNVDISNFGQLKLGDTIGKNINKNSEVYFKTKSNIKFDSGLVHTKSINILKTNRETDLRIDKTNIILLTTNSLPTFDLYIDNKLKDVLRENKCGNRTPITADTYDFQISSFANENNKEYDISYFKDGIEKNDFFVCFNKNEYSEVSGQINDIQYLNNLTKNYENKISSGYIKISGFYGDKSSANGLYYIKNNVAYCDDPHNNNIPIPTYINSNSEWILEYSESTKKWNLRSIKNLNFIESNSSDITKGFLATPSNNKGFFSGNELRVLEKYSVDSSGFVYDENKKIIGSKFQRGYVSINNRFKVIPNKLFFDLNKNDFNNFLIWKITITSKLNDEFKYEIPIVYINTNFEDESFLTKYRQVENRLLGLKIIQYQETSLCDLKIQNAVEWKISVPENFYGVFSNEIKLGTVGRTLLKTNLISNADTIENINGNYYMIGNDLINRSNFKFVYSEFYSDWKLKIPNQEDLLKNLKYPRTGIYKTTTKNLIGICKYEVKENNLVINVKKLTEEYETANGQYKIVGHLKSGEYMFRNENGWIFFTNDIGKSWQIQNAYKFPNYIIKEENTIPQAGVYTNSTELIKLTADLDIEFNFNNFRDFIGIDTDNLQLTSDLDKIRVFDKDGIEIQNTDDVELDITFTCIYADQVTENNFSIPCESSASFTDFSRYGDLIFNSNLEIISDNENEILTIDISSSETKYANKDYKLLQLNLNSEEPLRQYQDFNFYTNNYLNDKKYVAGEIVYFASKMWKCKKDIPTDKYILPNGDSNSSLYWSTHTSDYYMDFNVELNASIKKVRNKSITLSQIHNKVYTTSFLEIFESRAMIDSGIDLINKCNIQKTYDITKEYQPYDISRIGKSNEVVEFGKQKNHITNRYKRDKRIAINDETSTVSSSGYLCRKPAIVRTPAENFKNTDSFWFNQDKEFSSPNQLLDTNFQEPDEEPEISFTFEDYNIANEIMLVVSGFTQTEIVDANGEYEKLNRLYNDNYVFKKEDWYIYRGENCWILIKSSDFINVDLLNTKENIIWTSSETIKVNSDLNGNFGSSNEFVNDIGNVKLEFKKFLTPSPTPSPYPEVTPTPTQTETKTTFESPDTELEFKTPTPDNIFIQTPSPTPKYTSTPTPYTVESPFLFQYGDYVILKEKYDLSGSNPEKVEAKIKEDLSEYGYNMDSIVDVEDLIANEFILSQIPQEIKRFAVKVDIPENLLDGNIKTGTVNKYAWDSSTVTNNGFVRSYYLTKLAGGYQHKYLNQYQFDDYGFYIKSWFGKRCPLVKLKNQTDVVKNPSASGGLHTGILIKWEASKSADYIRIERKLGETDWHIIADNLSQELSVDGYLDTETQANQLVEYRIASISISKPVPVYSTVFYGWKLGIPDKPLNVNATYEAYTDKIIVKWSLPNETAYNKADSYTVLRSEINKFDEYSDYTTLTNDAKNNTYVDLFNESSEDETIYWYVIVANNDASRNLAINEYEKKQNWSDSNSGKLLTDKFNFAP